MAMGGGVLRTGLQKLRGLREAGAYSVAETLYEDKPVMVVPT